MSTGYIKGFDGVRALSIILVIVSHMGLHAVLPGNEWVRGRAWHLFSGVTGVNIFFVLSGFLITRILLHELERTGTLRLRRFYIRRFLRLSPPFVLFLAIAVLWRMLGFWRSEWSSLLLSAIYLYNYVPKVWYDGLLGHTWSLALEEQFYLLWPLLLGRIRAARIELLLGVVLLACGAVALWVPDLRIPGAKSVRFSGLFFVHRWFIPAVGPIVLGSLACLHLGYWSGFVSRYAGKVMIVLLYGSPLWLPLALMPLGFLLQGAGIALFLVALFGAQQTAWVRALEWFPLAYTGRISYGLYLYHQLFIAPKVDLALFRAPFNVAALLLLTIVSYEFVERPILRLKDRYR